MRIATNDDPAQAKRALAIMRSEIETGADVLRALGWYAAGMDLVDALHLASSGGTTAFASFDRGLAKTARKIGSRPPVVHP